MVRSRDGRSDPRQWHAREIERRNRKSSGKPLSPVMKTAATACELAHRTNVGESAEAAEAARA